MPEAEAGQHIGAHPGAGSLRVELLDHGVVLADVLGRNADRDQLDGAAVLLMNFGGSVEVTAPVARALTGDQDCGRCHPVVAPAAPRGPAGRRPHVRREPGSTRDSHTSSHSLACPPGRRQRRSRSSASPHLVRLPGVPPPGPRGMRTRQPATARRPATPRCNMPSRPVHTLPLSISTTTANATVNNNRQPPCFAATTPNGAVPESGRKNDQRVQAHHQQSRDRHTRRRDGVHRTAPIFLPTVHVGQYARISAYSSSTKAARCRKRLQQWGIRVADRRPPKSPRSVRRPSPGPSERHVGMWRDPMCTLRGWPHRCGQARSAR